MPAIISRSGAADVRVARMASPFVPRLIGMKLERCNPNPLGLSHANPFELSRPTPFGLSRPNPFGLSLSKPSASITPWTLRHGAFDKLSPLLRANGCCCQGARMFHASRVAQSAMEH